MAGMTLTDENEKQCILTALTSVKAESNAMKRASLFLLLIVLFSIQPTSVLAQSAPSCSFQPDGSILCTPVAGERQRWKRQSGTTTANGQACTPGEHTVYRCDLL